MYPTDLRHILVPIDFSELADQSLSVAIELARGSGARLGLLHVIHLSYLAEAAPDGSAGELLASMERDATTHLATRAARAAQRGVHAEITLKQGVPATEIVRFIERDQPDLVVLSTHGRTGIGHAVMGSVAERVVQRSSAPVLVLPAPRG